MKRLALNDMLEDIKRRLTLSYWNYSYKLDSWFFPGDLAPHNTKLKNYCKKLYEAGLLERQGNSNDRWGYRYKLAPSAGKEGERV